MITRTLLAIAIWLPSAARADCVGCHETRSDARLRDPVALVRGDVHGAHGESCVSCHGGDGDDDTMRAHGAAHGFRGRARGLAAVLMCGDCHLEIAREVRGGSHGRALAGARFAPSCTDCHAAHGTVEAPDPIEACARCHANARRMRATALAVDQTDEWAASVHGLARIAGNARAPACATCHDPHRAEGGLSASAACAECHAEIRAAFDRGPHAARFAELGFLDCVECHGSHEVRPADATMLRGATAVCARCHAEGTEPFARVRALVAQARGIEAARALPADDPRRMAAIEALHALDAEALARTVEGVPAPPRPIPEASPSVRVWALDLAKALGVAVAALAILAVGHRIVRRR